MREDTVGNARDYALFHLRNERRERFRHRVLKEIPRWYSPWGHLAATTGIGSAMIGLSACMLYNVRWTDLLAVPLVVVAADLFEWCLHKHILHRRRWPLTFAYDLHTSMHHVVYIEGDMELRSPTELRLVLLPIVGVVAIVIMTVPVALAVAQFWSANAAWLLLLVANLFMMSYEMLHLAYHLKEHSFVGRRRIIGLLRAHHQRHHDPRLMQNWNFNVTMPLFDWILGTFAPSDRGNI